jgi:GR25 family glycosyltransferase involved in LPS biosynthesis
MRLNVISLERTPERLAQFRQRNAHLSDVIAFRATDGLQLSRHDLVAQGFISAPEVNYTAGALGCMMSHSALWARAAETGEITTICEDDAIIKLDFERLALGVIAALPDHTDIIYWGFNFDAKMAIEPIAGVLPCTTCFGRNLLPSEIESFQRDTSVPIPVRLLRAFGIVCYTITPKGAKRLRQLCIPIRSEVWEFSEIGLRIANMGIDVAMANALPQLTAYCSFPPLAVSLNDPQQSTIQTRQES